MRSLLRWLELSACFMLWPLITALAYVFVGGSKIFMILGCLSVAPAALLVMVLWMHGDEHRFGRYAGFTMLGWLTTALTVIVLVSQYTAVFLMRPFGLHWVTPFALPRWFAEGPLIAGGGIFIILLFGRMIVPAGGDDSTLMLRKNAPSS